MHEHKRTSRQSIPRSANECWSMHTEVTHEASIVRDDRVHIWMKMSLALVLGGCKLFLTMRETSCARSPCC